MHDFLISVIIPTYNRDKTLLRSVESVLQQDYRNIELIIVDDNSNDNTKELIMGLNDVRIKYYHNNINKGACASRNIGIDMSVGDYIAFQDSDDYWYPNKLSIQIGDLIKNNADIVFCSMRNVNENSIFPNEKINGKKSIYMQFLEHNKAGTQTILGKSSVFKLNKFDETMPRFQEWELMIRLSKKFNIHQIDKILVDYYIQKDSISKNHAKGLLAIQKIYKMYYADIKTERSLKKTYLVTISQYMIATNENANAILFKALITKFDFKVLIKFIMCVFGFSSLLRRRWIEND